MDNRDGWERMGGWGRGVLLYELVVSHRFPQLRSVVREGPPGGPFGARPPEDHPRPG